MRQTMLEKYQCISFEIPFLITGHEQQGAFSDFPLTSQICKPFFSRFTIHLNHIQFCRIDSWSITLPRSNQTPDPYKIRPSGLLCVLPRFAFRYFPAKTYKGRCAKLIIERRKPISKLYPAMPLWKNNIPRGREEIRARNSRLAIG